MTVSDGV